MLVLETVLRIRREHASGKAIKAIARDLHLSRKVVCKAIRAPEADMGYRREVQPLPKLGPFQARLDALLEEDEARPRREKLRLTRIHDLLLREGFDGSYDAVRRYASRWRQARRRDVMDAPAFIPLLFRPGEAYQFDWSHEDVEISGKPMRVKVAHVRLCASRAMYVRAYPRETQEMLFDAHARAFAFFGGHDGQPRDCQEFCAGGRLPSLDDEALTEDYGELTFGLTPFARWALPFVRRVIEHEI